MTSLLDIAPSQNTVPIGGADVSVTGVSALGVVTLLSRFPAMRRLISGMDANLTAESIAAMVPEAIAAIIAAGTGTPGNPQAEAIAAALPLGTQVEVLGAILEATMPGGIGPFVEKVRAMFGGLNLSGFAAGLKAAATS